jgi:DNA-binding NtrC family response regulator
VLESVSVITNSKPAADLTVEAAMTGGTLPTPVMDIGPQSLQSFNLEGPLRKTRDEFEKAYFEYHLARESGSMTRVAEKTGLERTHLYRKLRQLGVNLARSKRNAL